MLKEILHKIDAQENSKDIDIGEIYALDLCLRLKMQCDHVGLILYSF